MNVIFEETAAERDTITAMRHELTRRLDSRELTLKAAAEQLGLAPEGVETLIRRTWTFEEAYRVSAALNLGFTATLEESS